MRKSRKFYNKTYGPNKIFKAVFINHFSLAETFLGERTILVASRFKFTTKTDMRLRNYVAPPEAFQGTQGCRAIPVENHWFKASTFFQ